MPASRIELFNGKYIDDQMANGVPEGGTTGQILAKASDADYDTEWVNGGSGITPNLQQVTDSGNTTTNDIYAQNLWTNYGGGITDDGQIIGEVITLRPIISDNTKQVFLAPRTDLPVSNNIINLPNTSTNYKVLALSVNGNYADANGDITISAGTGTVTSVGLSMPSAFTVSNSPVTTSGTLTVVGSGNTSQLIDGTGALQSIPTSLPPSGTAGGDLSGTYPNPTVDRIHGVDTQAGTPSANDVWVYGGSPAKWQHQGLNASQVTNDSAVTGTTVKDALNHLDTAKVETSRTISTTAPLSGGGDLSANRTLSISQANTSTNGYLSSADWNTFNNKQAALSGTGFVKISGTTISYDNSTYYLASNPNNYIGLTALSAGTGINYNNTTGVISSTITQYTDALARAAISLTTTGSNGSATYSSVTGILNIPTYTLAGLGGISLTSLSSTATGLTYTNTTGVFSLTSGYSIPTTASQANWDTGYTDRLKWDGGSSGLVAATGRTSLGATTVGSNLFTLTNPSAITFLRINADNSVSTLDAATFRTAIGAGTSSTTGTVTSVAALTLGTSGTDLSSTVANGTTTPVITLNVPDASATARGVLNSTDWTTFNNKQSALTFSTGLTNTSGTITNNLLVGVSGGQTIIGGTAASNNLTLSTTSNATKGKIILGTASAYDQANDRIGIGTTSPATKLDIVGNTTTLNTAQIATIGIQSFAVNNAWFGDNVYYNGTNFIRRATGYTGAFYFQGNEGQFRWGSTGNAGTSVTNGSSGYGLVSLKTNLDKTFAVGDMAAASSSYTGASFIVFGATGNAAIGTTTDSGYKLDVNGTIRSSQFYLSALNTAPASASATGTLGEIRIDANYIYICTATNTWKRAAIATW